MKLEVGKYYRTRGNEKVKILEIVEGQAFPVIGMRLRDDLWTPFRWTKDGRDYIGSQTFDNLIDSNFDIVEEWHKPKSGTFWVNVYGEGDYSLGYDSKNEADETKRYNSRIA